MTKKKLQLVQYLVTLASMLIGGVSYASNLNRVNSPISIKTFRVKDGILGISKNSFNKYDLYYSKGKLEYRLFENNQERYKFLKYNYGRKSIVVGEMKNLLTNSRFITVFRYKNGFRYASNFLCESENSFTKMTQLHSQISGLVTKIESKKVGQVFAESCSNIDSKDSIFRSLVVSINESNESLKSCLVDNDEMKAVMEKDDQFRRLMMTYYVNVLKFAQDFSSESPIVQFDCKDDDSQAKVELGASGKPHKISLSKKKYGQKMNYSKETFLGNEFTNFLLHELDHIYLEIPSVADANVCEHQYSKLIKTNCGELPGFNLGIGLPKCKVAVSNQHPPTTGIPGSAMASLTVQASSAAASTQSTEHAPTTATGERSKSLATVVADQGSVAAADTRTLSQPTVISEPVQSSFTPSVSSGIIREANLIFAEPELKNPDVQRAAAQLFEGQSGASQPSVLDQIASSFNRTLSTFSDGVSRLEAFGGPAVAATIQAGSLGGGAGGSVSGSDPKITLEDAINGYIGGPSLVPVTTIGAKGGSGLTASELPASKKFAVIPAGENVGANTKIVTTDGVAEITNTGGAGSQKIARVATGTAGVSGGSSGSNPYQINGSSEPTTSDTPQLLLLKVSNNIYETKYQEIRALYGDSKFLDDLKARGIAIQIVDKDNNNKVIANIGAKIDPQTLSRQPSSIDSDWESRKKSPSVRVFIDNGEGLTLAPAPK